VGIFTLDQGHTSNGFSVKIEFHFDIVASMQLSSTMNNYLSSAAPPTARSQEGLQELSSDLSPLVHHCWGVMILLISSPVLPTTNNAPQNITYNSRRINHIGKRRKRTTL
jgi:hypothetical protein